MWGNNLFIVSGETNKEWTQEAVDELVRGVLRNDSGLTDAELKRIKVINNLNVQSQEINAIVGESGTGDNGIYFGGYHKVYSPVIRKMKDLCSALTANVLSDWDYRTDGKFVFQVDPKGNIVNLTMNCASFEDSRPDDVAFSTFIRVFTGSDTNISINPKGNWSKCFAFADTGLTGRKLACDGTCGLFSHGGGAMFGKDISKADVTVPLYLNALAETLRGKVVELSAASIIGDTDIDIYKNGKFLLRESFDIMKNYVASRDLSVFGVLS